MVVLLCCCGVGVVVVLWWWCGGDVVVVSLADGKGVDEDGFASELIKVAPPRSVQVLWPLMVTKTCHRCNGVEPPYFR